MASAWFLAGNWPLSELHLLSTDHWSELQRPAVERLSRRTPEKFKTIIILLQSVYTARNDTDLMQVLDFSGLMQVCHHVTSSLLASSSALSL